MKYGDKHRSTKGVDKTVVGHAFWRLFYFTFCDVSLVLPLSPN